MGVRTVSASGHPGEKNHSDEHHSRFAMAQAGFGTSACIVSGEPLIRAGWVYTERDPHLTTLPDP